MLCTALLVGRRASANGSPLVARTEDSGNGTFDPKRVVVVQPADRPRTYTSVIGKRTITLSENPLRYTATPNALPNEGFWGCASVNAANVAMSATETITSNPRVLGADPLAEPDPTTGTPGGFGEEDFVPLVLPYTRTAREGVERLRELLAEHGTYEMNGIAFSDEQDIWWLETVGVHHWIARRIPEDHYVTMPNQLGIDSFDLDDAEGPGRDHLASPDLRELAHPGFVRRMTSFPATANAEPATSQLSPRHLTSPRR